MRGIPDERQQRKEGSWIPPASQIYAREATQYSMLGPTTGKDSNKDDDQWA